MFNGVVELCILFRSRDTSILLFAKRGFFGGAKKGGSPSNFLGTFFLVYLWPLNNHIQLTELVNYLVHSLFQWTPYYKGTTAENIKTFDFLFLFRSIERNRNKPVSPKLSIRILRQKFSLVSYVGTLDLASQKYFMFSFGTFRAEQRFMLEKICILKM